MSIREAAAAALVACALAVLFALDGADGARAQVAAWKDAWTAEAHEQFAPMDTLRIPPRAEGINLD